ncbi:BrnT family toxin [Candidatus Gottesmanbacteria bacterium]|nr:BrnT family toxin [Candidatus Gottesmanbacteria bacterium]
MAKIIDLTKIRLLGFDWDKGNIDKNWLKHKISGEEAEEIFYNEPLLIFEDLKHSEKEKRFVAYGITDQGRKLTEVFVIRKNKIRIISARDQSRKEKKIYEKT